MLETRGVERRPFSFRETEMAGTHKLHVSVQMNSPMEAVFAFKCVSAQDMNLEIRVRNDGDVPTIMQSRCILAGVKESLTVDYLYPAGPQIVAPGDAVAFYCFMDEEKFREFDRVELFDVEGRSYSVRFRE